MKYVAYKMIFRTGVHFGNGMLSETRNCFLADTLFSALCIEALKQGEDCLEQLYKLAKNGKLLFSDSFPYINDTLYIPKPIVNIKHSDDILSAKRWKKLKYIPINQLEQYFLGNLDVDSEIKKLNNELGCTKVREMVNLNNPKKSEPYSVGVYYFKEGSGLYFILGYEEEKDKYFIEDLLISVGYQGIGGKVSSGLGKYTLFPLKLEQEVVKNLEKQNGKFILLTTSLPREEEMENVIEGSTYLLERRGGFIQSVSYAEEHIEGFVKKQEMFFLKSGSVVKERFLGDVYNVGMKGKHFVWRYGKPILMEVSN